ncbi:MAG: ATPase [Flavobacteriales bacterium]|nr:ATPase [Flavobacteriales bacterium]
MSTELEIVSTRVFNFPLELVFRAWTEPEHLAAWWGPKGFTNTFHEYDLRPEGHWRFTMHGPEKGNYENHAVFERIERPTFLSWYRLSQPLFRVEVSFDTVSADQTSVVFKMIFDDLDLCNTIRKFAPEKNEENFDKLEVVLAKMLAAQD